MDTEGWVVLRVGALGAGVVAFADVGLLAIGGWIAKPRLLGPSAEQATIALLAMALLLGLALAAPVGVGWNVARRLGGSRRPRREVRWLGAAAGVLAFGIPGIVVNGPYAIVRYYSTRHGLGALLGLEEPSGLVYALGFAIGYGCSNLVALGLGALGSWLAERWVAPGLLPTSR